MQPDGRSDTINLAQVSQEKLVLSALLGDFISFDELVRRFRQAVVAVAESILGSRESAEDVAQEVFLLAFKTLPQLEDASKFAAWLYAITRRRARLLASQERRSEHYEPSNLDCFLLEHSAELISPQLMIQPLDALVREEERGHISRALSELPEAYHIILRLRYYEEWPVESIADFLSIPLTTAKWRLHHGRNLLRRQMVQDRADQHTEVNNGPDDREPFQHRSSPTGSTGRSRKGPDRISPRASYAARPREDRQGRQSHRRVGRGRANCSAALQSHPRAP